MKENRGRPKTLGLEEDKPRKWEKKYDNKDGTFDIWKYNLDINPNGPISVETIGKRINNEIQENKETNKEAVQEILSKTKMKYLNPANGKMVVYQRAKQLGII